MPNYEIPLTANFFRYHDSPYRFPRGLVERHGTFYARISSTTVPASVVVELREIPSDGRMGFPLGTGYWQPVEGGEPVLVSREQR